jgi:hypothetical protein
MLPQAVAHGEMITKAQAAFDANIETMRGHAGRGTKRLAIRP